MIVFVFFPTLVMLGCSVKSGLCCRIYVLGIHVDGAFFAIVGGSYCIQYNGLSLLYILAYSLR